MDKFVIRTRQLQSASDQQSTNTAEDASATATVIEVDDNEGNELHEATSASKRYRTPGEENRIFHLEWEQEFFFVEISARFMCLLCRHQTKVCKKFNFERHFKKHHEKCIKESFPSEELRAQELSRLKATHRKEKQFIRRVLSDAEEVTAASYDISWQLARCKKPFSDGELVKDMFLQSAARLGIRSVTM
jgi:hypothetical protein